MNKKYDGRVNIFFNFPYDKLRHSTLIIAYSTFNLHLHCHEFKPVYISVICWTVRLQTLFFRLRQQQWGEHFENINEGYSPKNIITVTVRIFEFMLGKYNVYAMVLLVEHCTTSRMVTGSIPDGIVRIFNWSNSSGRTMALGLYLLGVKAASE
jgi:hypothetical protein